MPSEINIALTTIARLFADALVGVGGNASDPIRYSDVYRATNSRSPRRGGHRHTVTFTAERHIPLYNSDNEEDPTVIHYDGFLTSQVRVANPRRNANRGGHGVSSNNSSNNSDSDGDSAPDVESEDPSSFGSPTPPPSSSLSDTSMSDVAPDHPRPFRPLAFSDEAPQSGGSGGPRLRRVGTIRVPPRQAAQAALSSQTASRLCDAARRLAELERALEERTEALERAEQAHLAAGLANRSLQYARPGLGPASIFGRRRLSFPSTTTPSTTSTRVFSPAGPSHTALYAPSPPQALAPAAPALQPSASSGRVSRLSDAQRYSRYRTTYFALARCRVPYTADAVIHEGPFRMVLVIVDDGSDGEVEEVFEDILPTDAHALEGLVEAAVGGMAEDLAEDPTYGEDSDADSDKDEEATEAPPSSTRPAKRSSPDGDAGAPSKKARFGKE